MLILGACTTKDIPLDAQPTLLQISPIPTSTNPSPTTPTHTPTPQGAAPSSSTHTPGAQTKTLTPQATPPSPTQLACWEESGRIEQAQINSELLPKPLDVRVYLPPCYDQETTRRYPVLYLIHGQSYNDDQWDRLGVDETADSLIASGELPPFLIVMPRDYACCTQPDQDKFGEAFVQELIPWVDQNYRSLTERQFRAIGGLSRGAGWAVHIGLSRWELFGAIGGHSLPIFWVDTSSIKKWLDAIPEGQFPRFYLDNPENDRPEILKSSLWFESLLTKRGIPHEWHRFKGYHEEKYWLAHIEQYLRWYAEEWKSGD